MDLMHRRLELALMAEIADYWSYAFEWEKLGVDFETAGWFCNAAICFSNAKRYAMIAASESRELTEASSRLFETAPMAGIGSGKGIILQNGQERVE